MRRNIADPGSVSPGYRHSRRHYSAQSYARNSLSSAFAPALPGPARRWSRSMLISHQKAQALVPAALTTIIQLVPCRGNAALLTRALPRVDRGMSSELTETFQHF